MEVTFTPETVASLAYLAPPGLQASAIALAVQLLGVIVAGDPAEGDELGEVLAAAVGWDAERLVEGLGRVRSAVQWAGWEHNEAMEEVQCYES